jgi:fibronectin-binding autotransporter adhesin
MKPRSHHLLGSLAVFAMTQAAHAAATTWDAEGGANTAWNYSSFLNWSGETNPTSGDLTFLATGSVSGTSTVTSSLDASYNINKLTAYNTGSNYQNFDLGGYTLTSASHVAFGFNTGGVSSATNATMKNGSFAMTSGNFIVGGSSGEANAGLAATVDFSNLTSTSIGNSSSLFVVGYYSKQASSNLGWGTAAMTLSSGTNTLTASRLLVGHTDGGSDAFANNSKNATLTLKGATDIKATSVSIAYGKRSTSSIATSGSTSVTLHGTSGGSSAITAFTVGGASVASGVGIIDGTADFSGGSLDGAITTLNLATGGILTSGNVNANSGKFITGTSGTLDVTNVNFGGAVTSTNATVVTLDIRGGAFRFDTWATGSGTGGSGSAKSLLLKAGTLSAINENANTISGLDVFQIGGTGAVAFGQTSGGTGALDISASAITLGANADVTVNVDTTLNGSISATSHGLTKSGAATLTLTSASLHTGDTTIAEGTLALGAGGAIASSAQIIVGANTTLDVAAVSGGFSVGSTVAQTLSGLGKVNGSMTIGSNGTLAIGSSPGTMTFAGDLGLGAGSVSKFEINDFSLGNFDLALASATGTQTVSFNGGTLNLLFQSGFNTSGTAKIFDFDGYGGDGFDVVSVTGLADGYTATFDASNGVVTVVPEPRAALLGLLGALALLRRRRI